jgi:hypothetical protein
MNEIVKQKKTKRGNPNWGKGISGNPNGRPPVPEIKEFREALDRAKKTHNKSLLDHFVERAYKSDVVLVAASKKILPDKVEQENIGETKIVIVRPEKDNNA